MNYKKLINQGAIFFINHSGGKDSQAMYLHLKDLGIPSEQIVIIHAELPGVDWEGLESHIRETTSERLITCSANKTFKDMVLHRGMFPSPQYRQCTSDLKRDPISKEIRKYCKETGNNLIVNCMGIRSEESTARSKLNPFKLNNRMSKAGRTVYEWYPIFDWLEGEVFDRISQEGQKPFWTYARGMSRCSCKFCIMSNYQDIYTASTIDPEAFQEMTDLENETGMTMFFEKAGKLSLAEYADRGRNQIQEKGRNFVCPVYEL